MNEETLKKIEDGVMNPIREIQDAGRKRLTDLQDEISELPDIGKELKRIEDKLDWIIAKLNA